MSTSNLGLNTFQSSDYVDVTKISSNFETIDSTLGKDYIVGQGVTATASYSWTYRKWKSGIYECWTTATTNSTPDSENWKMVAGGQELPVTFSSTPAIFATVYQEGYVQTHLAYCSATTNSFDVRADGIGGTKSIHASIYIIGTVTG